MITGPSFPSCTPENDFRFPMRRSCSLRAKGNTELQNLNASTLELRIEPTLRTPPDRGAAT
jgi:hypothetical protein